MITAAEFEKWLNVFNIHAGIPGGGTVTNVGSGTGLSGGPITGAGTLSLIIPVLVSSGGTGVTSVTSAPAATAWAGWDANKNMSAAGFIGGYVSTPTAAGTTTLTVGSTQQQRFTGTTTQTVTMPVTSTLVAGQSWRIVNDSTGVVTVQSSGGNTIQAMDAGTSMIVTCVSTSGTTAASWSGAYFAPGSSGTVTSITAGTGLTGGTITGSGTIALAIPVVVADGGTGLTTTTAFGLLAGGTTSTGAFQNIGIGASGTMLQGGGAGALPAFSTSTWPATTTINQLLYSSANNVVSELPTFGNNVLITDSFGAPGFSSALPSAVQDNITQLGTLIQALNMGNLQINNMATPSVSGDAATKGYVDSLVAGLAPGDSVQAATTTNFSATYVNGSSGIGATLTATATGVVTFDGQTILSGELYLFKDQISAFQNGVYLCNVAGALGVAAVFTRASTYDTPTQINETGIIPVVNGSTQAGFGYYQTNFVTTIGTDSITFVKFGNSGTVSSITAGTGLTGGTITSTGTIGLSIPVLVTSGGTGITAVTAHNLMIGAGTSALTLLPPSATSGVPLISQGSSADPAYGTAVVGGGGTGLTAITAHNLVIGAGTSPLTLLPPSATSGIPLISQGSSADPAYGTTVVGGGGTGLTAITAHNLVIGAGTSALTLLPPSATVGIPLISQGATSDPAYGTVVIGGGGTGVTSVTTAPAATAWAGWDANSNMSANSFIGGYATTATAAGTTTLTVASKQQQYFTGSTTQTVLMPVTSTLVTGQSFTVVNNSSGVVTVQSSGANTIQAMAASSTAIFTCISTSGTTAASWSVTYIVTSAGSGITTLNGDSGSATGSTVTITGSTTGFTFTGSGATLTLGGTLAIANGGTAKTSVTTAPAATSWAGWDANSNLSANNMKSGYTTTVAAAGTTTLTAASTYYQYFTGSNFQTILMPVTSTLTQGQSWFFVNLTNNSISIRSSGNNGITSINPNQTCLVTCILTTGTTAASWDHSVGLQGDAFPLQISNGGTGVTTVPSTISTGSFAAWDNNGNLFANNMLAGYSTTATAAGTTTLDVTSTQLQYFTGSTTQTLKLPNVGTLALGQSYRVVNNSTGVVTVQSSGSNTILAMAANTSAIFTCILTSGTGAASWDTQYVTQTPPASGSWVKISRSVASSSASIVFSGLNTTYQAYAVVMSNILPASSATLQLTYNAISANYGSVINGAGGGTASSNIAISGSTTISSAGVGLSGTLMMYNPDTANPQHVTWQASFGSTGGSSYTCITGSGVNSGTTAVTSITFAMSSGNIASGVFELYGLVS